MGTFAGHATPGVMFILYAIWHAVKQAHNRVKHAESESESPRHPVCHINSKLYRDGQYRTIQPIIRDVPLFPHDRIVEGAFFLACSCGGALGVVGYGGWSLVSHNGTFSENLNNWQHGTMFVFFGISNMVPILGQTKHRLQPEMGKLVQSIPFFVEAFLFHFHLHGRTELDMHLHNLLVLAILGSAVCLLAQAWNLRDPLLENMWVVFCLLHAMWFFMIGFVLYNPVRHGPTLSWDHDEHRSMMMVTAMFTWQFLLAIVINSVVRWIVGFCVNRRGNGEFHHLGQKEGSQFHLSKPEETAEMANLLDVTESGFEIDDGL